MHTVTPSHPSTPAAFVWLDRSHALIARAVEAGTGVTEIERSFDTEPGYLLRVAEQAADCDRLVVIGPEASRRAFEREYVALYDRQDRLVDAGLELEPGPGELIDRLRFLDLDPPDRA